MPPSGPARTWSLRHEWSRAFTIMLALLLLATVGTLAGVRQVVGRFHGTASQLEREATIVSSLRNRLNEHEDAAHQLLAGAPVDIRKYGREQDEISAGFDEARNVFPAGNDTSRMIEQAEASWRSALSTAGVWSDEVAALDAARVRREAPATPDRISADAAAGAERQAQLGTDSDRARALLDGLQKPSTDALHDGVADAAHLERLLLVTLAGLFGLALSVTIYFRRRMVTDLLRPVARMHRGLVQLQNGNYADRLEVTRRDELGELAEAFNAMTGALHDSHLALTLRATSDSLTGLPNRASLIERLTASFATGHERRARVESVLFIDIDDFKDVNDSLGHEGGDALLIQLTERLSGCVRPQDLVARLGGDEFAVIVVEDERGRCTAVDVADRILQAMHAPFAVNGTKLEVSVSIGVAQRGPETADVGALLRHADFAMYMAKGGGKGRQQVFDVHVHDSMVGRSVLKTELAVAVNFGQLRLEYQPVADLRTGEVLGVEALVRWEHPTLGLLGPAEFIGLAEETGDIDAIGRWVLDTATREAAAWRRAMDHCDDLWVAINVSARQLADRDSMAALGRILTDPSVEAHKVVLEVTESAVTADIAGASASLETMKQLGVRIAIDDFGTGYSSLSTLAGLPVDILKIDRSFVSGQTSVTPSVPMLEGILGLADKLSLDVVAEGIEQPEQLELLRRLGCHTGQGFLLGRPVPPFEITAMLAAGGLLAVPVAATGT